jgi:hypothetical protein
MDINNNQESGLKLYLGCGSDYRKGYVNIDRSPYTKKDLEWDLDVYPYPFANESVKYIYAKAVIEHLSDFIAFMEEAHRLLQKGGKLRFRVPLAFTHVDSIDPTHKQHLTPHTFNQFLKGGKRSILTQARFKGDLWITIPFFHKLKFHKSLYLLNSFVNNIFTGLEGVLVKK